MFSEKINLLKAFAIMLVVSGHLEFSMLGMFPPYSFQLALFFFISGMLFKEKYLSDACTFIKRRVKSLLFPYFLYEIFYVIVTCVIFHFTGKWWGRAVNTKKPYIDSVFKWTSNGFKLPAMVCSSIIYNNDSVFILP